MRCKNNIRVRQDQGYRAKSQSDEAKVWEGHPRVDTGVRSDKNTKVLAPVMNVLSASGAGAGAVSRKAGRSWLDPCSRQVVVDVETQLRGV